MKKGALELIVGCMASGKTEELVRRLKHATIAQQSVVVFKPAIDTRSDATTIVSRSGFTYSAVAVAQAADILKLIGTARVVGIEEVQFFDPEIIQVIRRLTDAEKRRVIVTGLDTDFRGEPFEHVAQLLALADRIDKLTAVCVKCFEAASRSQRLIGGDPAPYDAPRILVGGDECYEPRCRDCHEVPRTATKNV